MQFLHSASIFPKVLGKRGHLWLKPGVPLCVLSSGSAHEAVADARSDPALLAFLLSSGPPQMHASFSNAFLWCLTEQQHAPVHSHMAARSSQNAPAGASSAFLVLTHEPLAPFHGDRSVLNSGSSKNNASSGLRLRKQGIPCQAILQIEWVLQLFACRSAFNRLGSPSL